MHSTPRSSTPRGRTPLSAGTWLYCPSFRVAERVHVLLLYISHGRTTPKVGAVIFLKDTQTVWEIQKFGRRGRSGKSTRHNLRQNLPRTTCQQADCSCSRRSCVSYSHAGTMKVAAAVTVAAQPVIAVKHQRQLLGGVEPSVSTVPPVRSSGSRRCTCCRHQPRPADTPAAAMVDEAVTCEEAADKAAVSQRKQRLSQQGRRPAAGKDLYGDVLLHIQLRTRPGQGTLQLRALLLLPSDLIL